jgi:hypothetical protein
VCCAFITTMPSSRQHGREKKSNDCYIYDSLRGRFTSFPIWVHVSEGCSARRPTEVGSPRSEKLYREGTNHGVGRSRPAMDTTWKSHLPSSPSQPNGSELLPSRPCMMLTRQSGHSDRRQVRRVALRNSFIHCGRNRRPTVKVL